MQLETNQNNRGRSVSRPYPYAGRDTAQDECIKFCGISEREKQFVDTRKAWKFKIQIWKQKFLVQRILRRYSGQKCKSNKRIYPEPTKGRPDTRSNDIQGI